MKREWLIIFAGPVFWFLHLLLNFALAPWACTLGWKPALYVSSLVFLLLTAGAAFLGWSDWRNLGRTFPGEASGGGAVAQVLTSAEVLVNGAFFIVILDQALVEVFLGACS
jgi:hypothetical protein